MDIFRTHAGIVGAYRSYIHSFINIKDDEIRRVVEKELERGKLWPEPLIQFNPAFELRGGIEDVVANYKLHPKLRDIFAGYKLYTHQVQAIQLGTAGHDFVVTSGTGSGKSLTYMGSIFHHLLTSGQIAGIAAVVVYPMNALINSQYEEFERYAKNFVERTGQPFPIRYGQYTGQENEEERKKMRDEPPHVLLTNYMMLELLLTRSREREIRDAIYRQLRFLVFDELHTYRGRQGADVSLLIRRVRANCEQVVTCVGTSATMVSGGTLAEQKVRVAAVAEKLFGKAFTPQQIIEETLARSFDSTGALPTREELAAALAAPISETADAETLKRHPIAIWLENKIALTEKEGHLVRGFPRRFGEVVRELADDSGTDEVCCRERLEALLRWISQVNTGQGKGSYTFLPFKLHQFLSQTGSVYTTLDQNEHRKITLEPGVYQADTENRKPIFPNVFSRASGHAFLCLTKDGGKLEPREFRASTEEGDEKQGKDGYLFVGEDVWSSDEDLELFPEAWKRQPARGGWVVRPEYKSRLPTRLWFDESGNYSEHEPKKFQGWFMPAPLLFDPTGGVFFDTKTKEGTKLTKLGNEGRSTSTTITAFSILHQLDESGIEPRDQKLLSFTDNRQDAALQAGHFNDFTQVVQLRAAIRTALHNAPGNTLDYTNLGEAIFAALNLPFLDFANTNTVPAFPNVRRDYEQALQKYLVYRALYDLRRGWRVVLPNLEQCALLTVDYRDLDEVAAAGEAWAAVPLVNELTTAQRREFLTIILDFFRQEYAIFSENYLTQAKIQAAEKEIREKLRSPWKFDDDENITLPAYLRHNTLARNTNLFTRSVGAASTLGKFIRQEAKRLRSAADFSNEGYRTFIVQLLQTLESADYLKSAPARDAENAETLVYQLRLDRILWRAGDGKTVRADVVKQRSYKAPTPKPNPFFRDIYLRDFSKMKKLRGEDHTGQLSTDKRIDREERFRAGEISALFCSPTMELGIDIANLSVVHLRNAPPNPANYAQRGGRAGRSGQAALVFTYCSGYSPHDRHYFKHQTDLVAGAVAPPKLDLSNQDLLSAHLHALLLSEVGLEGLNRSIMELVDEEANDLPLSSETRSQLTVAPEKLQQVKLAFRRVVHDFEDTLKGNGWYSETWIDRTLARVADDLDAALARWRRIYRSARETLSRATQQIDSGRLALNSPEYRREKRNQDQATRQLDLLKNKLAGLSSQLSEFYPYRYLASEGFLPGYNFTRLPLRVFLETDDTGGEFLSRPRAIALREFGPQNVIYHNGQKYELRQLLIQDAESALKEAKISRKAGYFLTDAEKGLQFCPFSGADLSDSANVEHLHHLVEMSETRARRRDRISCEEEERLSRGFEIDTYFSVDAGRFDAVRSASVRNEAESFINLRFIPAARLVHVNRKWRASEGDGFRMGMISGEWKKAADPQAQPNPNAEPVKLIKLFTSHTADALYIEPTKPLALSAEGIITLQYALKRAIENVFQIESNELGVVSMGETDCPNIFLYEAAEGSLGILSQFVTDVACFRGIVEEAIRLCRFDDTEYKGPASYDDLLSYYNQRDHAVIDRFLIRDALEKLRACNIELSTNAAFRDYEAHYAAMLRGLDPNSSTERKFLTYLYQNGLRLPDATQRTVDGLYVQPDFFYEPNFWVFCDGTPHDTPAVQADDEQKRQSIRSRGDEVFVYYYKDNLANRLATRPDIFKKVK